MKERPILFSGPMVRAILDGTKSQTRRVVRPKWWRCLDPEDVDDRVKAVAMCPYGAPGDRLWVREAWRIVSSSHDSDGPGDDMWSAIRYEADGARQDLREADIPEGWRPPKVAKNKGLVTPLFMPRWASRITLEVVNVRVERVQEIGAAEIIAEGAVARAHISEDLGKMPISAFDGKAYVDLRSLWRAGWNSINAARGFGWDANPWVWVVEFRRVAT